MRISRSTGAVCGGLLIVLGLWGGLSPFLGPYFGYAFGSNVTWHYTTERLWLSILPAAAVVIGGLLLLRAGHRVHGALATWLAMAGGAWFAVGPAVSRLWVHGTGPIGGPLYGHTRVMLELVGSFYGVGVVAVGLAAFALGRVVTRPSPAAEPQTPEPVAAADIGDLGAGGDNGREESGSAGVQAPGDASPGVQAPGDATAPEQPAEQPHHVGT